MLTSCRKETNQGSETATDNLQEAIKEVDTAQAKTLIEPDTSATAAPGTAAMMDFVSREHDFGTINQGEKVSHVFKFTNTGKSDLIISEAKGTCGCTVPDYPKTPVKPGASGEIKVSFDSAGKSGMQQKSVNITANTPTGKEQLNIRVNIKPKA